MAQTPPRYSANLYSRRTAAPSLESRLALTADASSPSQLDDALRRARAEHAGRMMEQLERARAQRTDFLLDTIGHDGGNA